MFPLHISYIFFYFLFSVPKIHSIKVYVMHVDTIHFYLPCFFRSPAWIRRRIVNCSVKYTQLNPRAAIVRHTYGHGRFLFESRKNPDVSSDSEGIVALACLRISSDPALRRMCKNIRKTAIVSIMNNLFLQFATCDTIIFREKLRMWQLL